MAKAECVTDKLQGNIKKGIFKFNGAINPVDVKPELILRLFDVIYIRPVPILKNIEAEGNYFDSESSCIPLDLNWNFPEKISK